VPVGSIGISLHQQVNLAANERVRQAGERAGFNLADNRRRVDHCHNCLSLGLHDIKRVSQDGDGNASHKLALTWNRGGTGNRITHAAILSWFTGLCPVATEPDRGNQQIVVLSTGGGQPRAVSVAAPSRYPMLIRLVEFPRFRRRSCLRLTTAFRSAGLKTTEVS
jgi:hypothetical protein